MSDLHRETRSVHLPEVVPAGSRPVGTPIYQTHVFAFETADALAASFNGPDAAFLYSRHNNPTVRTFEKGVADLEGGTGALATSSGMGAVNAVFMGLLRSGDHVIAQRCLYGGTYALLKTLTERWGIEVTFVSGNDPEEVRAALRPRTRLLYLETIANPTTQVTDVPALAAVVKDAQVLTVVDNTFATPVLFRPLEHGADIVLHSATKFLGGHADVLAGVVVFADPAVHREIWDHAMELGASLDPHAAWLLVRGLATLPLRVARHSGNALSLAQRLSEHPAVASVSYPGLPGHPQHELAKRLLDGASGGVLAFDLAGGREAGRTFAEAVRLASLAPSLGDVKTLVMPPASTSHRKLDAAALAAAEIGEGTVRISVGIEHPDDLWNDLEQALNKAI